MNDIIFYFNVQMLKMARYVQVNYSLSIRGEVATYS